MKPNGEGADGPTDLPERLATHHRRSHLGSGVMPRCRLGACSGGPQEPRTPAQQQYSRRMLFAQGARYTLSGFSLLALELTPLGQPWQGQRYEPIFVLFALVIPFVCYIPVWIIWLKRPR